MKKAIWTFFCIMLSTSSMAGERASQPFIIQKPGGAATAPPFSLPDINGNLVRLNDHNGKIILIHFWSTWCTSCKEEMPGITALRDEFKDRGFEVLAIAGDSERATRRFAREHNLSFPVLIDQYGSALRSYSVRTFPISYIVGRAGDIKGVAIGPRDWTSKEAGNLINALIEERGEEFDKDNQKDR